MSKKEVRKMWSNARRTVEDVAGATFMEMEFFRREGWEIPTGHEMLNKEWWFREWGWAVDVKEIEEWWYGVGERIKGGGGRGAARR